jgi:nucleolar protein 58
VKEFLWFFFYFFLFIFFFLPLCLVFLVWLIFSLPSGYALFKVADDAQLKQMADNAENGDYSASTVSAENLMFLKSFHTFGDMTDALSEATAIVEGSVGSIMQDFLKENVISKGLKDKLLIADKGLAQSIHKELGIDCEGQTRLALESTRLIRNHFSALLPDVADSTMTQMNLGLAHSLSRYKLKFSPDKVDTMIVQAVSILDDLDKELNTYAMRAREWYGWHFPEMAKILNDNETFCRVVQIMGDRTKCATTDFTEIMEEDVADELREAAQISMGTEISTEDLENITMLCDQVIAIGKYRKQLGDYLRNRMNAIAPNLTVMVGELVGARLIAHCGSLMALAKSPASTIQILGAEKALFRAIKTKHETPKYGLIFHASLIGQASQKFKGKIARVLAGKTALAIRMDAFGESDDAQVGEQGRATVEERLRALENRSSGGYVKSAGSERKKPFTKYEPKVDEIMASGGGAGSTTTIESKKRARDEDGSIVPGQEGGLTKEQEKALKKQKKKEKKEKKEKKKSKKEKK